MTETVFANPWYGYKVFLMLGSKRNTLRLTCKEIGTWMFWEAVQMSRMVDIPKTLGFRFWWHCFLAM